MAVSIDKIIYPLKEHKFVLPKNIVAEDITDFQNGRSHNTCDVFLKEFRNVRISHDSLIYQNGKLVRETLAEENHKSVYLVRHYIKQRIFAKTMHLNDNNNYLLATHFYSPGHFHWLCEVLPQLICLKEDSKNFILLLPDNNYVRTIGIQSLEILGIHFKDLLLMQSNQFYKARKVFYINNCAKMGLNTSLISAIQRRLVSGKEKGTDKIYVSRAGAAYRKVLNEKDLLPVLKNYGFEYYHSEDYTLQEQIKQYTNTEALIGIHGAGLANCIFMHPQSSIIELRKKENKPSNIGFWQLATGLGHNYYYYNAHPDEEKSIVGRGCNITVDIKDFENKVLKQL